MGYLDCDNRDPEKFYSYTDEDGIRRNEDAYCIYCGKIDCKCKLWKCGLYRERVNKKEK
jgi:hypothetical protein